MISLSTPSFDLDGSRRFATGSAEAAPLSRRARRVATLDGGAALSDLGFSAADIDFRIKIAGSTRAEHEWLQAKLAVYQTMILSCAAGCFLVLLSNLAHQAGTSSFKAEVLEKLSL